MKSLRTDAIRQGVAPLTQISEIMLLAAVKDPSAGSWHADGLLRRRDCEMFTPSMPA